MKGPKLDKQTYEAIRLGGKDWERAKKRDPKLAEIRSQVARVCYERMANRRADPLILAKNRRKSRLSLIRLERKERARRLVRASLMRAARIARSMGLRVESSRYKGRVSSYYIQTRNGPVRISDHEIPQTPTREARAMANGYATYEGFGGIEIIIDRPRRAEWLRRAIILAVNGRQI